MSIIVRFAKNFLARYHVIDGEATKFTYDANGNRIRIERGAQIIDAAHNERDQPLNRAAPLIPIHNAAN